MSKYFLPTDSFRERRLNEGVMLRLFWGRNMTLSIVDLRPESVIPAHSHPHEQMGIVLEGELAFTIGDETRTVRKGDFYCIPSGVVHSVQAGGQAAKALDIFSPPREDYRT
jgi:quercetin dioxygenase-like cupin family protein